MPRIATPAFLLVFATFFASCTTSLITSCFGILSLKLQWTSMDYRWLRAGLIGINPAAMLYVCEVHRACVYGMSPNLCVCVCVCESVL